MRDGDQVLPRINGHFGVEPDQRAVLRAQVNELLDRCVQAFENAGVPVAVVSGGSTPSRYESDLFHGVNEVRSGTYIFNDRNTVGVSAARNDASWADKRS